MSERKLNKEVILLAVALALAPGVPLLADTPPRQRSVTVYAGDDAQDILTLADATGWLGIGIAEVNAERMKELKLPEERGVVVTGIEKDSPGEKAGLKENDVIVEYSSQRVEGARQLRRLIRETPAGRNVTLGLYRAGQKLNLTATLGERPESFGALRMRRLEMPEIRVPHFEYDFDFDGRAWLGGFGRSRPHLGVEVESLSDQLGQFFGVKEGEGVLVRHVEKGSAAEKAGIKAGDVITRIESEKISDAGDLREAMYENRDRKSISVTLVRNRAETTVTVEIERPRREGRTISSRVKI